MAPLHPVVLHTDCGFSLLNEHRACEHQRLHLVLTQEAEQVLVQDRWM